jgi:2-polyprenyl-3-methyl-5-hydroxy-6-metoxy-1,4-benzoquinol methylase
MAFKNLIIHIIHEKTLSPEGGRALDLGCGGKALDSQFMAKEGFEVHAVDKEADFLHALAEKNAAIHTHLSRIEDFVIEKSHYNLLIASFSLQFLTREAARSTIMAMVDGAVPGGVIIFNVIGDLDAWKNNPGWYVWTRTEIADFISQIPGVTLRNFNENQGLGGTMKGEMKFWHTFDIVLVKG